MGDAAKEQKDEAADAPAAFSDVVSDDWRQMADGLRQRRAEAKAAKKREGRAQAEGDDDDDIAGPDWDDSDEPACSRTCCFYFATLALAFAIVGAWQLWLYFHPKPLSCNLELIRPQKFKVDVSDFFSPKISAALQLVLSVKNSNLRAMLLEGCRLTAYEDGTNLKLGATQQGALVVSPFSTTQVTVTLQQLAGALPPPEQRRIATAFLAKKALLLTIVATATSRIPKKGSTPSQVRARRRRARARV